MANKWALNYAQQSTNDTWSAVWKLTRVMKAAGWTVKAHSDGTTKTAPGTNNNDSWGSNADPLNDTFPAFTAAGWIVMEGPKTLKLPLTGAPVGTFLRGEGVTQASTGAKGELLGVVWDSGTASGWAVIMPRTGTFNGTNAVTGDLSGAGFTPSSIKTFTREVMFHKAASSVVNGTITYVCADQSAESASLFSTLATSAGATATVAPGSGGTGNAFPAIAICIRGTGGSVSHADWFLSTSGFSGFANLAAVNATPAADVSADGTFWGMAGRATPTNSQTMFGFFRLDDCEPGDVEPYAWFHIAFNAVGSYSRTAQSSFTNTVDTRWADLFFNSHVGWKGYLARDCPQTARDAATYFLGGYRNTDDNTFFPALMVGQPNQHRVANHPSATPPFLRDFMCLVTDSAYSGGPSFRMFKGTVRWVLLTSNGQYKETFDNKQWVVLYPYVNGTNPGVIVGPWDGSTTPS